MSEPMIAITKELRDEIVGLIGVIHFSGPETRAMESKLRAAPEPVSLEGVETALKIIENHPASTPYIISTAQEALSDLRRLVAPVQPSAVVSEQEILNALKVYTNRESCDQELLAHKLHALQLPKPQTVGRVDLSGVATILREEHRKRLGLVDRNFWLIDHPDHKNNGCEVCRTVAHLQAPAESPKQTGAVGVEASPSRLKELVRQSEEAFPGRPQLQVAFLGQLLEREGNLTTTQSAPSVGSVPSEWIPVTERLPDDGVQVLVMVHGTRRVAQWTGEKWGLNIPGMWCEVFPEQVTHWQLLPPAPVKVADHE